MTHPNIKYLLNIIQRELYAKDQDFTTWLSHKNDLL